MKEQYGGQNPEKVGCGDHKLQNGHPQKTLGHLRMGSGGGRRSELIYICPMAYGSLDPSGPIVPTPTGPSDPRLYLALYIL